MTSIARSSTPPEWLHEAVRGLVVAAYEAGKAEAGATVAPVPVDEPEFLTRKETAALLRVSLTTVNSLIQSGDLPSKKVGARRVVLRSAALAQVTETEAD